MSQPTSSPAASAAPLRLAYLVSHPIQYQAPLLRRIAQQPDIHLTVFFGSDFSTRGYKDQGFGVEVAWDTPLTEGYEHVFLRPALPGRASAETVSATSPFSRGIYRHLRNADGSPAFDALWVHGYASINSLHGIFAAKGLGIPVLLRAESWLGDRRRSSLKLALKHLLLTELRSFIDATLPIGTLNRQYWRHYLGTGMPQFVMPYAVDNDFFHRRALEAQPLVHTLRKILNLHPQRPVILFASKLQPRKHCDHLIEAFAALLQQWPPSTAAAPAALPPQLVIVGEGEERRALEAQANCHGLDADIAFAGFQNQTELPSFFALADVFVLPSRHEPWGLIVNEAMAAGCAVVLSTDVGCYQDLLSDGVEGALFPAGDVPALTAALRRIFASPATAQHMGARALERIAAWSFAEDIRGLRHALAHVTRKLKP